MNDVPTAQNSTEFVEAHTGRTLDELDALVARTFVNRGFCPTPAAESEARP